LVTDSILVYTLFCPKEFMMFKKILSVVMAIVLVGVTLPAFGAPASKARATGPQVFDFEGDTIETEFLRPNSAMVETLRRGAGLSLVRIKTSFLDKILSTVDEL
jgi:hypothetical protein